jgi:hypothetical protein
MPGKERKEQVERAAFTETVFRRANEIIRKRADEVGAERFSILCECGDSTCLQWVELSLPEYEAVRSNPTWFAVIPGHEFTDPDIDRVVRTGDTYNVVEKVGDAAEVARHLLPQRRADDAHERSEASEEAELG